MHPLEDMGRFKTVVIDPPWPIKPRGSLSARKTSGGTFQNHLTYAAMSIQEIANFPLPSVLEEHAFVFCWTVNKFIPQAFEVMLSWGMKYQCTIIWHKQGGPQYPGNPCYNAEWCIVGRKGNPQFLDTKSFALANNWPRGAHSAKPEGFYDLLRRVTPAPRLDVFGRRRIAGFQSWGDEAPEGEALPDHYQEVLM